MLNVLKNFDKGVREVLLQHEEALRLQQEKARVKTEMRTCLSRVPSLEKKIATLESTNTSLSGQNSILSSRISSNNTDLAALSNQLTDVQRENAEIKARLQEEADRRQAAEAQLASILSRLTILENDRLTQLTIDDQLVEPEFAIEEGDDEGSVRSQAPSQATEGSSIVSDISKVTNEV